ncbi:nuclease EXOG, mitochondrial isoform X2 [Cherax quadricarinatus]|uniref:nuclease EXOG, mitochondrial isoform X2 n=1 Tax=Cherax quadricarinatus TaxID=27406 RepID=UPI00387E82B5
MKLPFVGGVVAGCLSTMGWITFSKLSYSSSETSTKDDPHFADLSKAPIKIRSSEGFSHYPEENTRVEQILRFGWPIGGRIKRKLKNHVLEYDCTNKIPVWVAEHLTQESLKGTASRQVARFKMDPHIPKKFSAQNSDYKDSGWSRGHMSPAGNNKMLQVIGENEVAVPTHLYKVIVAHNGDNIVTGSFVVPNKPIDYSHHLKEFQVTMDYLERKVGNKFYTNMNRDEARDLCEDTGCNLMSKTEMDEYIITQRLKGVNSLKKLAKLWKNMEKKGISANTKVQELYQKRLLDLSREEAQAGAMLATAHTVDVPSREITPGKNLDDGESTAAHKHLERVAASG